MKSAQELVEARSCNQKSEICPSISRSEEPTHSEEENKEIDAARQNLYALLKESKISLRSEMCRGYWNQKEGVVALTKTTGKLRNHVGFLIPGDLHRRLHPEEALFMISAVKAHSIGTANINKSFLSFFCAFVCKGVVDKVSFGFEGSLELVASRGTVPLSLEQAMSLMGTHLNFTHYLVYAHLSRGGYQVVRHLKPGDKRAIVAAELYAEASKEAPSGSQNTNSDTGNFVVNGMPPDDVDEETKVLHFLQSAKNYMEEARTPTDRMDFRGIKTTWFPQTPPRPSDPSNWDNVSPEDMMRGMESFPNNRGGCVTIVIPPPASCFPFPVRWNEGEAITSDSRYYTQAPLRSFGTKRRRIERRDFWRPSNWLYVPRWTLENSRSWKEYKRNVDEWLRGFHKETRRVTDHLWEGDVKPLVEPKNLSSLPAPEISKQLQIIPSLDGDECLSSQSETSGRPGLTFTYDLHSPQTEYSITLPDIPRMRIVVLQNTQKILTHNDISGLRGSFIDDADICLGIVSGSSMQFLIFDETSLTNFTEVL